MNLARVVMAELEAFYGDFDLAQPLDASERSWRMIVVLSKQEDELAKE